MSTSDGRAQCLCETFARVTERSALAGARWLGRADQDAAEEAAFSGARIALEQLPISGHVVIGAHEDAEQLATGSTIGAGGEEYDLALDPLEGRAVVARGGTNAVSMIAAAPRGTMPSLPEMYMRKMAVGPVARGSIALDAAVGDNIRSIADAFGRMVNDITAIVLDRPRHHDLIEEIRAAGARIKLIQDGDVTASISAAVRGTNDHLSIGIGGTRQAVLAAAALRCLGGELQAQLWPTRRAEIEGQNVKVTYTLTSMGCPAGQMIEEDIDRVLHEIPGVEGVSSELTFDPPWTPDKMSDDAKFILGFG